MNTCVLRGIVPFALLLVGLAAGGCGDAYGGRQAISGTVTFKGQPLDQGFITFIPTSQDQTTQSGTAITNGKYSIPRDKGLVPGTYRISISSSDGKTPDLEAGALPGPSGNFSSKDRIPMDYNINSKHEIVVKKGEANTFEFNIP